jgi:hypothetical protein
MPKISTPITSVPVSKRDGKEMTFMPPMLPGMSTGADLVCNTKGAEPGLHLAAVFTAI